MLRQKILTVVAVWFSVFLVTGCTDAGADELEIIEQAIEKNKTLENGRFSQSALSSTDEEAHESVAEGAFIKQGDSEYDWYVITYPNAAVDNSFTERRLIDGNHQVKVTVPEQEMTWNEIPDEPETLPYEIEPLFEMQDIENIDSVTTEEAGEATQYIFTLDALHSEQVIEENVEALEENIKFLEAQEIPEEVIQIVEDRIEEIKETDYSDFICTYTVNNEGYATQLETQFKMTYPDGMELSSHHTYTLDEMNASNTNGFIPAVE